MMNVIEKINQAIKKHQTIKPKWQKIQFCIFHLNYSYFFDENCEEYVNELLIFNLLDSGLCEVYRLEYQVKETAASVIRFDFLKQGTPFYDCLPFFVKLEDFHYLEIAQIIMDVFNKEKSKIVQQEIKQ